ncbi:MAG: hypothetical protein ACSLEN_13085 [Candidatus Malihini olakiniferum]
MILPLNWWWYQRRGLVLCLRPSLCAFALCYGQRVIMNDLVASITQGDEIRAKLQAIVG